MDREVVAHLVASRLLRQVEADVAGRAGGARVRPQHLLVEGDRRDPGAEGARASCGRDDLDHGAAGPGAPAVGGPELGEHLQPFLHGVRLASDLVGEPEGGDALGPGRLQRGVEGHGGGAELRVDAVADPERREAQARERAWPAALEPFQQVAAVRGRVPVAAGGGDHEHQAFVRELLGRHLVHGKDLRREAREAPRGLAA
jgi:hypothetical protein